MGDFPDARALPRRYDGCMQRQPLGDDINRRALEPLLDRLSADVAALQADGVADEHRARFYEAVLALAALDQDQRIALAERSIADADALDDPLIRALARLVALSHLPDAQRTVAAELSALLAR